MAPTSSPNLLPPRYPLIGYGHEESIANKSFFPFSAMKGNNDRNRIERAKRSGDAEGGNDMMARG